MPEPLEHHAEARSLRTALILSLVWTGIATLWGVLDAAPFVVGLLALATLPAAWDFARARAAWLRLDADQLAWRSGGTSGEVALPRIAAVRLETRLDLSVRVRVVLDTGKRITLPQDCLPHDAALEAALTARGVPTERHHFGLWQG